MKKLLVVAAAVSLFSCSKGRYEKNDLELVGQYSAREMCSCLFVMAQDETFCRAWTRASPSVAKYDIDMEGKTVRASAVTLWGGKARFVNARSGCVLE